MCVEVNFYFFLFARQKINLFGAKISLFAAKINLFAAKINLFAAKIGKNKFVIRDVVIVIGQPKFANIDLRTVVLRCR